MDIRYEISTHTSGEGKIVQDTFLVEKDSVRSLILRQVIDTQDAGIKSVLKGLGWRHDGGIAALDIPNKPSPLDPLGQHTHRVTIRDVELMEKQLRLIADALHL